MARRISRHEIFAREYVKDLNGTRAAIAAGYSRKTARVTASQLLTKPNIQKLLAELTKRAFGNPGDCPERDLAAAIAKRVLEQYLKYLRGKTREERSG